MEILSNSFIANFGKEPVVEWKLLNDGTIKANFIRNGIEWEAIFKVNGTLVKHYATNKEA